MSVAPLTKAKSEHFAGFEKDAFGRFVSLVRFFLFGDGFSVARVDNSQ